MSYNSRMIYPNHMRTFSGWEERTTTQNYLVIYFFSKFSDNTNLQLFGNIINILGFPLIYPIFSREGGAVITYYIITYSLSKQLWGLKFDPSMLSLFLYTFFHEHSTFVL